MSEKIIIFDLGKVVFDYDVEKMAKELLSYSDYKNPDITNIYESTFKYERGQISSLDFYKNAAEIFKLQNLSFEKFSKIWNEIFTADKNIMELIKELSQKNYVALLSNTNELHFEYLYKLNKDFFDKCFKKLHLSYLMNVRKPENEIYKQVINFHKTEPENIFFTDDVEQNIAAAKTAGMNAHIFKGIEKLKTDLKNFGAEL